jgi:hypothetical protein
MASSPSDQAPQRLPSTRLLEARRLRILRELKYLGRELENSSQRTAKNGERGAGMGHVQAKAA